MTDSTTRGSTASQAPASLLAPTAREALVRAPRPRPGLPLLTPAKRHLPLAESARAHDRSTRPIHAVWELTLRCDLACRHCGSRAGAARPDELTTAELPTEAWTGGNVRDYLLVDIWERGQALRYTRDRTVKDLWGYCGDCYYADHCRARYVGAWELPVLGTVAAPLAVLIRPDGYVAWVGAGVDPQLRAALTRWFGAPAFA